MAKKSSRGLTEQERVERRRQDRERLQLAAEQLLTSEGWRCWVRVRSQAGLGRLSISNHLLVAMARPDAAFVAGFKAWLWFGFAVRKGERAIAIIAPLRLFAQATRMTQGRAGIDLSPVGHRAECCLAGPHARRQKVARESARIAHELPSHELESRASGTKRLQMRAIFRVM